MPQILGDSRESLNHAEMLLVARRAGHRRGDGVVDAAEGPGRNGFGLHAVVIVPTGIAAEQPTQKSAVTIFAAALGVVPIVPAQAQAAAQRAGVGNGGGAAEQHNRQHENEFAHDKHQASKRGSDFRKLIGGGPGTCGRIIVAGGGGI